MKPKIPTFTHEYLLSVLHYDPETGSFVRIKKTNRNHLVGAKMGHVRPDGRCCIIFCGARVLRSRLAWFYMTGSWPKEEIDHKNCDNGDDRWVNLREANRSQNMANCRRLARNTSGFKGVTWAKRERKWVAALNINQRSVNLGYFDDPEVAADAVRTAAEKAYQGYWRAA